MSTQMDRVVDVPVFSSASLYPGGSMCILIFSQPFLKPFLCSTHYWSFGMILQAHSGFLLILAGIAARGTTHSTVLCISKGISEEARPHPHSTAVS